MVTAPFSINNGEKSYLPNTNVPVTYDQACRVVKNGGSIILDPRS